MKPNAAEKPLKIPFDSLTLRAVVSELQVLLTGGQIQDIRQPAPTELRLAVRSQGQNFLLLIAWDAQFARAHLVTSRRPGPPSPPNFCMVLRKYLENGVIEKIQQRDFDRVLEIVVQSRDDQGEPRLLTLVAELMGKQSNVVLLDETRRIVDAAKRVTHRINRLRETLPGLPYQPPPASPDKFDPLAPDALTPLLAEFAARPVAEDDSDALSALLTARFAGMSPFLAQELAARIFAAADVETGLRAAWETIFGALTRGALEPITARDAGGSLQGAYPFPLLQAGAAHWKQTRTDDLNAALEQTFADLTQRADAQSVAGELRGKIERALRRLERQLQDAERSLRDAEMAEGYKQTGELILANMWQIQPGAASVSVQDYYAADFAERAIPLDVRLTPQENADLWFRRYHKARDGQRAAEEQRGEIIARLEKLTDAQEKLTALADAGEIRALRADLLARGLLPATSDADDETDTRSARLPDFQGHKIRRVITPEGYEILIGETATANDFLTARLAASNDYWLHVRAATSAHVVVRTHGRPADVPKSVLTRAARLCAQHSGQKHSSLISVDYTLKKYVRKPRGAAPGSVDYQQETTLHVAPESQG